jgi:hypothetical protein
MADAVAQAPDTDQIRAAMPVSVTSKALQERMRRERACAELMRRIELQQLCDTNWCRR